MCLLYSAVPDNVQTTIDSFHHLEYNESKFAQGTSTFTCKASASPTVLLDKYDCQPSTENIDYISIISTHHEI